MQYFRVDETGLIIEALNENEESEFVIEGWSEDQSLCMPVYDFENKIWIEGLSQEEIDVQINSQPEPTLLQRVESAEMAILTLLDFI